jgi:hypothetical protein
MTSPNFLILGWSRQLSNSFEKELLKNGWNISYAGQHEKSDLVFVVGGTRKLFWLWKIRLKKIPVVYRLDGISWLHKKGKINLKNYFFLNPEI